MRDINFRLQDCNVRPTVEMRNNIVPCPIKEVSNAPKFLTKKSTQTQTWYFNDSQWMIVVLLLFKFAFFCLQVLYTMRNLMHLECKENTLNFYWVEFICRTAIAPHQSESKRYSLVDAPTEFWLAPTPIWRHYSHAQP